MTIMKKLRSTTSWFAALALASTPAVFADDHDHKDKDKERDIKKEQTVEVRTDSPVAVDSTTELTTFDQDESEASIERTAAIRRALMDDEDLSTKAKNVKIITVESGDVHLRGEVESAAEKAKIEALARESGAVKLHNNLTVEEKE